MLTVIMAGQVKLFQSVQTIYQTIGAISPKSNQIRSINSNTLFFGLSIMSMFISNCAFLFIKASTITEYGTSFYGFTSILMVFVDFILTIWQMPNISFLIAHFQDFIEKSKFIVDNKQINFAFTNFNLSIGLEDDSTTLTTYSVLNEKIERFSKLLHFAVVKVTLAGATIPSILTALINYFILNLGDESYPVIPLLLAKLILFFFQTKTH